MSDIRPRHSSWQTGMFVHLDVDRHDLDPYEFRVYAHLCCRANEEMRTWVKQLTVAAITGISLRKVNDALQSLEEKGWIKREARYRDDGSRTTDNILILGPPSKPERYEPSPEALHAIKPPKRRKDQGARGAGGDDPESPTPNMHEVQGGYARGAGGICTTRIAEVVPSEVIPGEVEPEDSSPLRSEESSSGGFATGAAGEREDTPVCRGPVLGGDDGHTRGADGEAGTQAESVRQTKPTPVKRAKPKRTPTPKAPAPRPRNPVFDAAARFIVGSEDPAALGAAGSEANKVVGHLKTHGITEPDEITRVGQFIQSECFVSPGVVKHGSWVKWLPDYLARREAILAGKAYEPVRQEKSAGGLRPQVAAILRQKEVESAAAIEAHREAPKPELPTELMGFLKRTEPIPAPEPAAAPEEEFTW